MTKLMVRQVSRVYHIRMAVEISKPCLSFLARPVVCFLPKELQARIDCLGTSKLYLSNTVLFQEGQAADRVFVVQHGKVRVSMHSGRGERLTLGIYGPGEILGLSPCVTRKRYETTAKSVDRVKVSVVERDAPLELLRGEQLACWQVVSLLCHDLHTAREQVRWVAFLPD